MLRVGLIGAGYLGKIHLSLLTEMNNIHFAGFFDTNVENSAILNQKYHTTPFTNADDLINNCDALVIATPTTSHFEYVKKCIQTGKAIFVEKPATATIEQIDQIQSMLKDTQIIVQVGMVERFNPAFTSTLPYLINIERVFCNRLAPFTPRGADVSVVFDVMIHDLDIVLSLAKSEVKHIRAHGEKLISKTYDIVSAAVEFENGMLAHFTASRMAERKYRLIEFFTPKNGYKVDLLNKKVFTYALNHTRKFIPEDAYIAQLTDETTIKEIDVVESNAIGEELKSFVDCIINTKKVVVSLDDGRRCMQLAQQIEDQMNQEL